MSCSASNAAMRAPASFGPRRNLCCSSPKEWLRNGWNGIAASLRRRRGMRGSMRNLLVPATLWVAVVSWPEELSSAGARSLSLKPDRRPPPPALAQEADRPDGLPPIRQGPVARVPGLFECLEVQLVLKLRPAPPGWNPTPGAHSGRALRCLTVRTRSHVGRPHEEGVPWSGARSVAHSALHPPAVPGDEHGRRQSRSERSHCRKAPCGAVPPQAEDSAFQSVRLDVVLVVDQPRAVLTMADGDAPGSLHDFAHGVAVDRLGPRVDLGQQVVESAHALMQRPQRTHGHPGRPPGGSRVVRGPRQELVRSRVALRELLGGPHARCRPGTFRGTNGPGAHVPTRGGWIPEQARAPESPEVATMERIMVAKRPGRPPQSPPLDLRTPSGRPLPY